MLIQFDLQCSVPVLVLRGGEVYGVISAEPTRQTVVIPAEATIVFESAPQTYYLSNYHFYNAEEC